MNLYSSVTGGYDNKLFIGNRCLLFFTVTIGDD